jgi:DNA modification methylase
MGRISDIAKNQKEYKSAITENIVPLKRGDIFEIGQHRLIYGDATNSREIAQLMNGKFANMIFTDPPFNMSNDRVGSVASITDFINAGGEFSQEEFTIFLTQMSNNLYDFSAKNSIHYICIDWRNILPLLTATKHYEKFKSLIVWNKCNGGLGNFYRNQYELIFVFQKGNGKFTQNFSFKNYRTNLWSYHGQSVFGFDKKQGIDRVHPTMKPVKLVIDAIKDCSNENDIVLDLFGGSGTSMVAAHLTNRICFMSELDEKFCNVIIRRMLILDDSLRVFRDGVDVSELFKISIKEKSMF